MTLAVRGLTTNYSRPRMEGPTLAGREAGRGIGEYSWGGEEEGWSIWRTEQVVEVDAKA